MQIVTEDFNVGTYPGYIYFYSRMLYDLQKTYPSVLSQGVDVV